MPEDMSAFVNAPYLVRFVGSVRRPKPAIHCALVDNST